MAEPDGTQKKSAKQATVQRKRRRLYESLPAEEEEAITRVIKKNTVGKKVIARGNARPGRAPKPPKVSDSVSAPVSESGSSSDSIERDRVAWDIIGEYIYRVGANALIPIPVVDLAAVVFKQTEMLRKLAATYDVDYDEYLAMDIVRRVWKAYNGFTMGAIVFGSAAKMVPFLGSAVGMGPVSFSAAASTYTLGKLVIEENR